ncbi:MAG: hypothetical protein LUO83_01400 [Methanothrix sp.]|nr:hypothetical protein [Methanothrix sp.]
MQSCLPKDEASNFIAERERSDVVHHLRAFLAERVLDVIGTSRRRSGAFWTSWWATWGQGGGSHTKDQAAVLL